MEHIAQGKRSGTLGPPMLEQSRPERAKALSYGAALEQNIHAIFHFKTAFSCQVRIAT